MLRKTREFWRWVALVGKRTSVGLVQVGASVGVDARLFVAGFDTYFYQREDWGWSIWKYAGKTS